MLAAAIAAVGYLPARERLVAWAKHAVYGAREAPDEALRTFGNRLTRAIPMDELLLQLAESLRKTHGSDQRRGLHRRSTTYLSVPCRCQTPVPARSS